MAATPRLSGLDGPDIIMLAQTSIRTKIAIVLGFHLIALTGMGLVGVVSQRAINANADEMRAHWLPSVRALSELHNAAVTYRSTIRMHLLAETEQAKAASEAKLDSTVRNIAQIRRGYEKLIASPQERALYEDWAAQWNIFEAGSQKVLALSRASVGKFPTEARDLNESTVVPAGLQSDELLKRDIELNSRGADAAGQAASETYDWAFRLQAILVGVSLAFGIGIGIYLVRDVSRGIASIVAPMQALGAGDLSAAIPHQGEKTEIGSMADALQVFKTALIDKKAADAAVAQDGEAKVERARKVDGITRQFESMIGEIAETVSSASTELEASADTLTKTAARSQELTVLVAAASEDATTNVQSVATATEQMVLSINEIGRQVQESARIANAAVGQARKTNDRVGELSQAAGRIGAVVELINTIAGQTNLLALNATIEAARAGEAGRGFAVVASEVKALAEQTAKATGEISQQIGGIQTATQDSVAAIKEIGDTIGKMSEIASTIASAVEEQGTATQEISRNVQQAAHGTQQVSANITDVQQGSSETGSASSQVFSAAQSLSSESSRLKLEVGKFLHAVRTA
jgi:methyl-accepting chemotaxis protein